MATVNCRTVALFAFDLSLGVFDGTIFDDRNCTIVVSSDEVDWVCG